MNTYERIGISWKPFLMYFHQANFKSDHLNTDDIGIRYTIRENTKLSPKSSAKALGSKVSIITGGSTAFGVGASSDSETIQSHLTKLKNQTYLNLGGRAFTCNQERILFDQIAYELPSLNNVVVFSGLNDLFLSRFASKADYFGVFCYYSQYINSMNKEVFSKKRWLLKKLLTPVLGNKVEYNTISPKELMDILFAKSLSLGKAVNQDKIPRYNINLAIKQLKKSLFTWKKLSQSYPFKLIYILQPFPKWMRKKLSAEEKRLFEYLDANNEDYNALSMLSINLYQKFSKEIRHICDHLDIEFYDSNELLRDCVNESDWIFVDRAHLTDKGNAIIANMISSILS